MSRDKLEQLKADLASQGRSTARVDAVLSNYDRIDLNGDGVGLDELRTYNKQARLGTAVDGGLGPKTISRDDLSLLKNQMPQGRKSTDAVNQMLAAFDKIDADQDGAVTVSEINKYAAENGIQLHGRGKLGGMGRAHAHRCHHREEEDDDMPAPPPAEGTDPAGPTGGTADPVPGAEGTPSSGGTGPVAGPAETPETLPTSSGSSSPEPAESGSATSATDGGAEGTAPSAGDTASTSATAASIEGSITALALNKYLATAVAGATGETLLGSI